MVGKKTRYKLSTDKDILCLKFEKVKYCKMRFFGDSLSLN